MLDSEDAASHACLDENKLSELIEARLAGYDLLQTHGHLANCASCRRLLEAAAEMLAEADLDRLDQGTCVGRYVVIERIGAGAMGTVYVARDPDLERKVALKILRSDESLRGRLLREAQAIARLAHPNVVTAYDVGVHVGRLFVAMEFVRGGTLRTWLAAERRSWRRTLAAFIQAGRGLACAHAAGLVHRDMPDEMIVDLSESYSWFNISNNGTLKIYEATWPKTDWPRGQPPLGGGL